MTLKDAFFKDLASHLRTWKDGLAKAIADPQTASRAETHGAIERLHRKGFSDDDLKDLNAVLNEYFTGILHSTLVTIDGGTDLSEIGRIELIDADTKEPLTDGALHEEFFEYLAQQDLI